jgi:DNA invertase Pin-like site-specific DNA recombinase
MRAVIYTANAPRTDIIDQHTVLRQYAEKNKMTVVRSVSDIWNKPTKSISGLQSLMKTAEERVMELVLVHDMALFGTSISHFLQFVQALSKHKVGVYFYKQCLTTHGHTGLETLKVLSYLAEAETQKCSIRIRAGMRQAEANGVRLGRPSVINSSTESCVVALRQRGMSIANIARTMGVGVGTTYRILRDSEALECV